MMKRIVCVVALAFALCLCSSAQEKKVPSVSSDKLLSEILSQYKGNVVLVDFWATWCGPCRRAHGILEPMKDSRLKDVNFVYITSDTSPKKEWKIMINNIKGDHYYLTGDQLKVIYRQIESNAFPTYLIVGKDGKVIQKFIGYDDAVPALLEKALK